LTITGGKLRQELIIYPLHDISIDTKKPYFLIKGYSPPLAPGISYLWQQPF